VRAIEAERESMAGVVELELSPHLVKRMEDRRFTEIDLRRMLQRGVRPP